MTAAPAFVVQNYLVYPYRKNVNVVTCERLPTDNRKNAIDESSKLRFKYMHLQFG